jgi:hypothetical protein
MRTENTSEGIMKEPLSNSTSRPSQLATSSFKTKNVTIQSISKNSRQPSLRNVIGETTPILRNQVSFLGGSNLMAKGFGDALKKKVDLQMRELEEDKMPIFPKVDEADPGVRSMSPTKKEDYRKSIIR